MKAIILARASTKGREEGHSIAAHDYDQKARELKDRQTEIAMRIEQHRPEK
ncbi:MAG TPA: hypothetical protein VFA23_10895 [Dongiaceae bacterium]|nr:hypothetical protein [Dongiaceae bacterium]